MKTTKTKPDYPREYESRKKPVMGGFPPVCVKCARKMKPEKNSVTVCGYYQDRPQEIWNADLWKCRYCGYEVIIGFGYRPYTSIYEKDFERELKKVDYRVNY